MFACMPSLSIASHGNVHLPTPILDGTDDDDNDENDDENDDDETEGEESEEEFENSGDDEELDCKGFITFGPQIPTTTSWDDRWGQCYDVHIGVAYRPGDLSDRSLCEESWQFEGDRTWKPVPDNWKTGEIFSVCCPKKGKYKFKYRVRCFNLLTGEWCEDIVSTVFTVPVPFTDREKKTPVQDEEFQNQNETETHEMPLSVSPNPSNGNINLTFVLSAEDEEDPKVFVFNSQGQVVHHEVVAADFGENKLSMDLSDKLIAGIYFIQVSTGNKRFISKAVIRD